MTRRLRRLPEFEVSLLIKKDDFINPPREAQKNWVLNRALAEFTGDLKHLDQLSKRFVAGCDQVRFDDRSQRELTDQEIMEDWQIPVMRAMAEACSESHGDVLEVGFGRGVSADFIQQAGVSSHTVIECSDFVVAKFNAWKEGRPGADIRLLHGKWQDVTGQLEQYDGIFFHTYPLTEEEYVDLAVKSVTFAEHFFPTASANLRPAGRFTYLTNEIDSLSRGHQRLLFEHFRSFTLTRVDLLQIPADTRDALWGDSMVVVKAIK